MASPRQSTVVPQRGTHGVVEGPCHIPACSSVLWRFQGVGGLKLHERGGELLGQAIMNLVAINCRSRSLDAKRPQSALFLLQGLFRLDPLGDVPEKANQARSPIVGDPVAGMEVSVEDAAVLPQYRAASHSG